MTKEIESLITSALAGAEVDVNAEGNSFQLKIISDEFDGLSSLKRQQRVYSCINDKIASGEIHAVTMRLFTKAEWEKHSKFSL